MILSCVKTGRFWRCASTAEAMRTARVNGLIDYEIEPV